MHSVVRAATVIGSNHLVPELRLHLSPEPIAPWEATERFTGSIQPPPFWAHAWPGGVALARLVLDAPDLVRGRRVLDFASGCGVSALAAARAGALEVVASEVDAFACAAIEENARLNALKVRSADGDLIGRDDGWDVVLVGDVFYQDELSRRVLAWLLRLRARGAEVRIGDPGRSFLPQRALVCEATYSVAPVLAWDSVVDRRARVWSLADDAVRSALP